ncbi:fructose-bisphosphate aldolase, class I [Cohaesibacter sp. ES.047]|uniref:class I fructose-bisphosphate aldolase n=1 Tax=Cohaesibacter sp. ES.047 TaxID=1798205 RepID=UPI000BB915B6|nr:fructose-bisphosphate aldolase [Cohaesibacter sp. ES.047]SNY92886.1 fructose-bisphosphate aldolase, class I [Cohaesibacter sp. ES.047]
MLQKLGQQIRLSRIVKPKTRRGFCIAFDHALQLGTCQGMENPEQMLDQMAEAGVDAVILPLGSALHFGSRLVENGGPSLILRLDQTTMWREGTPLAYQDGYTRPVARVEDAVALGAEAVITYLFVGHNDPNVETAAFRMNADVNEAARQHGIVHIIETMGARHALAEDINDGEFVRFHARIGLEMGADIIKTDWPGSTEALKKITSELPLPIMLAGGPKTNSDFGTLQLVSQIVEAGAAGILFGRSIFQSDNPLALMKACRSVIHDNTSAQEAAELAKLSRPAT